MTRPCGCSARAVSAVDEPAHARWHALTLEQTGLATGPVDAAALRRARGMKTLGLPSHTVLDQRAVDSGRRVPGWRREASR